MKNISKMLNYLLHQKINKRFLSKTPLTDRSLVKGKDLDLLKQVTDYLDQFDLKYEIRGSVQKNAKRGLPRTYRDLDILVRREETKKTYPVIMTLSRIAAGIDVHSKGVDEIDAVYPPLFGIYVAHETLMHQMYLNCYIDNRFKIERKDPKTIIDLCFEGTKVDSSKNFIKLSDYSMTKRS